VAVRRSTFHLNINRKTLGVDEPLRRFTCKSQGDRRGSNPRPSEPQPNVRYSQVFTTAKPYEQDGNCPYLFPPVCFPPPPIGVSTGVLIISLPLGRRSSSRSDVTRSMRSSQRKVRHPYW
jgi:hypothetical protein